MHHAGKFVLANLLPFVIGAAFLVTIVVWKPVIIRRPAMDKITIGEKDTIYYSHVTAQEATTLGEALRKLGLFSDRGMNVLLSRDRTGPLVSFVLDDGAWNHSSVVESFEEIGRRIATSIGGFPIQVRLVDSSWHTRKSLAIGKLLMGSKDEIYYFGSVTIGDAKALGHALHEEGYLQDRGVSVVLSRDESTAIGFVVDEGVRDRPATIVQFTDLVRRVAPSIGGPPLHVRLLSPNMEIMREAEVH